MVKVTSLLINAGSGPGFSFGVRAWTEMEIWCVNGMFILKVVSSEKNLWFKGLNTEWNFKGCAREQRSQVLTK